MSGLLHIIDLRTLSVAFCIESFALSMVFFTFAWQNGNFGGSYTLGLATFILSTAYMLLTFQGMATSIITIAAANTLVIVTLCLIARWLRAFFGTKSLNTVAHIAAAAFTFASQSFFVLFAPDHYARLALLNITIAALLAEISYLFLTKCSIGALRRNVSASGVLMAALSVFFVVKSAAAIISPRNFAQTYLNSQSGNPKLAAIVTLILAMITVIGLFIGFILMITVKLSETIIDRESKLACYANELEEINATKDKFFSMVSHDLRGPVGSIDTLLGQVLQSMDGGDSNKERVKLLKEATEGLKEFLNNLLDWAMAQGRDIECRPEALPLARLVDEAVSLQKIRAVEKNISVENMVGTEHAVFADGKMILTVLLNLLSNSIKFTPDNGSVTVTAKRRDGRVEISVADSGVGIDAEKIEKLFKLDGAKVARGTRDEVGRGLGLIVCREFAGRNNGFISVESSKGAGSRFSVTLPAA